MRRGLADWFTLGIKCYRPFFLLIQAQVLAIAGRTEQARAAFDEVLTAIEQTDERYVEAEVHRLKGELLLTQCGAETEAEACFHRALEVARLQQAKSLELRATMSLCRLWQKQGKRQEARQMLAEIYDWFTEGLDTADLREAKALLEEL